MFYLSKDGFTIYDMYECVVGFMIDNKFTQEIDLGFGKKKVCDKMYIDGLNATEMEAIVHVLKSQSYRRVSK